MLDVVETGFELVVMTATGFLAVHSLQLASFFKGGTLGRDFGLIGRGAVLLLVADVLGILGRILGIGVFAWVELTLEALFFILLTVAVTRFYNAWHIGFQKLALLSPTPKPVELEMP